MGNVFSRSVLQRKLRFHESARFGQSRGERSPTGQQIHPMTPEFADQLQKWLTNRSSEFITFSKVSLGWTWMMTQCRFTCCLFRWEVTVNLSSSGKENVLCVQLFSFSRHACAFSTKIQKIFQVIVLRNASCRPREKCC